MHKIKEKLMDELMDVEEKMKKAGGGKISASDLEYIHKLTDSIKNIDKIEILEEGGGYSEESNWMADGRMYGTSYESGTSYARGRGRNAKRDSMGRYSRDGGMSYNDGSMSYARGGNRGGSRGGQGRGGYSRDGYSMDSGVEYMMEKAEEMLESAENEQQRQAIHKFMKELERI